MHGEGRLFLFLIGGLEWIGGGVDEVIIAVVQVEIEGGGMELRWHIMVVAGLMMWVNQLATSFVGQRGGGCRPREGLYCN